MKLVFVDDDIIVIDKSPGEIVHPAPGEHDFVISDELKKLYPEISKVGSVTRPGVVHRLDKDTSGVMVFARNDKAYRFLRRQFESHDKIEKTYIAVCHLTPPREKGTIDEPVDREMRKAVSHWEVLAKRGGVSLVEFRIETGRMHQIRKHASRLGCPIVGDGLYGDKIKDSRLKRRPNRTLLHSTQISFIHPSARKRVSFSSCPPEDIIYAIS